MQKLGPWGQASIIIIIPGRLQKHPFMKSNIRCTKEFGCARCAKKKTQKKEIIFGSNSCAKIEFCQKQLQKWINFSKF